MKICVHKGLVIAVLTRDEHCPPHVHVGTADWDARFKFSFWNDGVQLWDVHPAKNEPKVDVLENLRNVIKKPANLRKARELWWKAFATVCLDKQEWDLKTDEVVSPKEKRKAVVAIKAASFEPKGYKTILQLAGYSEPLEIEL